MVICEFSQIPFPPLNAVYGIYLRRVLPAVAKLISSNPDSYEYLGESIQDWPNQRALARRLEATGFEAVSWWNLSFGIVALHRAYRP